MGGFLILIDADAGAAEEMMTVDVVGGATSIFSDWS